MNTSTQTRTYYAKGSWFDAAQLMQGDIVQIGAYTDGPKASNTLVVADSVHVQGEGVLVEWADGGINTFEPAARCWVVGDTHEREADVVDDVDVEEVEDFGVERKIPYVECEEPSERITRLTRGALGGPSKLYPNLHGFGWDVTHTPKQERREDYPLKARKVQQLIEQAERLLAVTNNGDAS